MDWKYLRWETPVSDAQGLMMELLLLGGKLEVILDPSSEFVPAPNVKITFSEAMAFRGLEESYMNALWGTFAKKGSPGRTFLVEDSPWITALGEQDSLFAEMCKGARHYVIATDMQVLEVISKFPPRIDG